MIWESPSPFVLFKLFLNKKIVDCSGIRSRIVGVEGMHSDHLTITPTQVNNFRASVLVPPFVTGFLFFLGRIRRCPDVMISRSRPTQFLLRRSRRSSSSSSRTCGSSQSLSRLASLSSCPTSF